MKNNLLSLALVFGVTTSVSAADLNVFTPGTPAKASEVNENFSNLDSRISDIQSRLDSLDDTGGTAPAEGISTESLRSTGVYIYRRAGTPPNGFSNPTYWCDTLKRTASVQEDGATVHIDIFTESMNPDESCQETRTTFKTIDGSSRMTAYSEKYEHDFIEHEFTREYKPDGVLMWTKDVIQFGKSYASVVENKDTYSHSGEELISGIGVWTTSYHPTSGAFSTPYNGGGTMEDCVAVQYSQFGASVDSVSIICPNIGTIAIQNRYGSWQLTEIVK